MKNINILVSGNGISSTNLLKKIIPSLKEDFVVLDSKNDNENKLKDKDFFDVIEKR